jgi:uncharacterized protein (DUF1330 family)
MHANPFAPYGLELGADDLPAGLAQLGDGAITLVNHFAIRPVADYDDPSIEACSGVEAMMRYAAVSERCLAAVGGRFLTQGLGAHALWGEDDEWDLLVVAAYPSTAALLALLRDEEYQQAFVHRRAAVHRQRVTVSATIS